MLGLLLRSVACVATVLVHSAHGGVVPDLHVRAAAACTLSGIMNGGFESGALTPWTFRPTYTNYGTSTCQVVASGASGSAHSAELVTASKPGDPVIVGTLSQTFTACENVQYSIAWSLLQVKGKTTYDGNSAPSMSAVLYSPNGISYTIADYAIAKTNFTRAGKTYQAGSWVAQTAALTFGQTGNWTLYFRTFAPSASSGAGTANVMRLDGVSVTAA